MGSTVLFFFFSGAYCLFPDYLNQLEGQKRLRLHLDIIYKSARKDWPTVLLQGYLHVVIHLLIFSIIWLLPRSIQQVTGA